MNLKITPHIVHLSHTTLCIAPINDLLSAIVVPDISQYQTARPRIFSQEDIRASIFSPSELEQINNFKALKKQAEWMCGRFCIKYLMNHSGTPMEETEIAYRKWGAPYIANRPELSISISHSGNYVGGALCTNSNMLCGLDIEKTDRDNMDTFMNVAYTERERDSAETPEERYTIWTAKEAFLKFIGKGFHENLKNIEYNDGNLYFKGKKISGTIHTKMIDPNHIYTCILGSKTEADILLEKEK